MKKKIYVLVTFTNYNYEFTSQVLKYLALRMSKHSVQ